MMTNVEIDYRLFSLMCSVMLMFVLLVALLIVDIVRKKKRFQEIENLITVCRDGYKDVYEKMGGIVQKSKNGDDLNETQTEIIDMQLRVIKHVYYDFDELAQFANAGVIEVNRQNEKF